MAGESILKHEIIAKYITNLLKRVRSLERTVGLMERQADFEAADPPQDGNFFVDQRSSFDTVQVTSIASAETFLALRLIPDSVDATGWITDPEFSAKPVTVTIPSNVSMPAVGDIVGVQFTGTYGTNPQVARYGLFGAGGSSVQQFLLVDDFDDHMTGLLWNGNTTMVGTVVEVIAKPHILRRTPFDGNTVGILSYSYSSPTNRVVTRTTDSEQQTQVVIPTYNNSFTIFYAVGVVDIGVTVAGTPVALLDINTDSRMWAEAF